jgi:tripartite-type tricarboxylate transporter receptor subunit TctC
MLVPFPPAGSLDNVGRVVAQRLQERLGQPFVVENRAGAGGHIGAELVARAPADGYTLLFAGTWLAIAPSLQKLAYDAPRDLAGVSMLSLGSFVLVAQRAQPFSTFQAFLSAARAQPGRLSYGSQGNGSGPHLSMAWLSELAGISLLHVPYKGSAQNVQAVLSGEVNVAFEPAITVLPHLRAGTLKALAVGSPTPLATLPDVPPVAAIYPGFDTDGWQALFAPAGTPADVRQRLSAEIARVMAMPEVVSMLRNLGTEPLSSSPDQVDTMLRAQIASWGRIIRQNGIKAD